MKLRCDLNDKHFINIDVSLSSFFIHLPSPPLSLYLPLSPYLSLSRGGAVAQSIERATSGEEVPGSIRAVAALSLLVGSVSV